MAIKTCKACGKLFEGTGTASYCSGPHMLHVKFAGSNLSATLEYITDAVLQNVKRS